jgi:hypothetical protein
MGGWTVGMTQKARKTGHPKRFPKKEHAKPDMANI